MNTEYCSAPLPQMWGDSKRNSFGAKTFDSNMKEMEMLKIENERVKQVNIRLKEFLHSYESIGKSLLS